MKKWYQSTGVWGGVTALLASAFMLANMIFSGAVDPEVIETLQSEQLVEAIEVGIIVLDDQASAAGGYDEKRIRKNEKRNTG